MSYYDYGDPVDRDLSRLKDDINDLKNWKLVKESYRTFYACKPGYGVQVQNMFNGMTYTTSSKYPWVILGLPGEMYVDSDDLQVEDISGVDVTQMYKTVVPGTEKDPKNLLINNKCTWKRLRVAGGSHQDKLKGVSVNDIKNCRQYYAFYLNPNKYNAEALRQFSWTVDNETCKGTIYNSKIRPSRYGLGNFLVCKANAQGFNRPDLTMIDFIAGDVFIQRFNAKPFKLKKIDEAIEVYNREANCGKHHVIEPTRELTNIQNDDRNINKDDKVQPKTFNDIIKFLYKLNDRIFDSVESRFLRETDDSVTDFKAVGPNNGKSYKLKDSYVMHGKKAGKTKSKYTCAIEEMIPEKVKQRSKKLSIKHEAKNLDMYNMFKCQNDLIGFKASMELYLVEFETDNLHGMNSHLAARYTLVFKDKRGKKKTFVKAKGFVGENAVDGIVYTFCEFIDKGFEWMIANSK